MTGIYKITNLTNNKIYIGQSTNIQVRFRTHKKYNTPEKFNGSLSFEQEKNMPIHQAIMKYGLSNFNFEIIEECPKEELNKKEKYYIEFYNSKVPNGYNIKDGGCQWGGIKGELNHLNKYNQEDIDKIKQLLLKGKKPVDIAKIFPNIKIDTIYSINEGKSWRDDNFTYPLNKLKGNYKYNSEVLENIKTEFNFLVQDFGKMKSYNILAEKYNYSIRSIMRIVNETV